MHAFPDIQLCYGQSDEYSFLFKRQTTLYDRRESKIVSNLVSTFTSNYVLKWSEFFKDKLLYAPSFDGRAVLYPSELNVKDYFSWRQTDCHINNLVSFDTQNCLDR